MRVSRAVLALAAACALSPVAGAEAQRGVDNPVLQATGICGRDAVNPPLCFVNPVPTVNTDNVQCEAPFGLTPDAIVAGQLPSGDPAITEYFYDGAYRTTRCDSNGRPVLTMEAHPIELLGKEGELVYVPSEIIYPQGAEPADPGSHTPQGDGAGAQQDRLIIDWLEPSDPEMIAAWTGPEGAERRAGVLPPVVDPSFVLPARSAAVTPSGSESADGEPDRTARPPAAPDNGCTFNGLSSNSRSATITEGNVRFYIKDNTLSGSHIASGSAEQVRNRIAYGADVWNNTVTDTACGFGDQDNVRMRYGGDSTGKGLGRPRARGEACDGFAHLDFGDIANLNYVDANGKRITNEGVNAVTSVCRPDDADVRFVRLDSRRWSIAPPSGSNQRDILSTAAHEFGHVIGLKDLYAKETGWLTMHGTGFPGYTYRRTLGRGDINSMRALYPNTRRSEP